MSSSDIARVYNQVGHFYNRDRRGLRSTNYLHHLLQLLPKSAAVLDVGCGNGEPVATTLTQKNHLVTGIDIAANQISAARRLCPRGAFFVRDMENLQAGEFTVDAVVCLYALFHVAREKHAHLLQIFRTFLPVEGLLLLSMGDRDFEGETDFYGQALWSSHYGYHTNRKLVAESGFVILRDEIDHSGGEAHHIILAQASS